MPQKGCPRAEKKGNNLEGAIVGVQTFAQAPKSQKYVTVFVVTHTSDCGMKHSTPIFVNVNCVEKFAAGKKC